MLIAHRGYYTKYIPENSMLAFIKCVLKNIPIELDVHLTRDNKVVVFHDYNLYRMTKLNKNIEDVTYDEIKSLYLKNSKEKIPLLEEVLKVVNDKVLILIELKNKKIGPLEEEVLKLTKKYKNIYFQNFKIKSVYYLKKRTNKKVGLLVMNKISKKYLHSKMIDFISHNLYTYNFIKTDKEIFIFNIDNKAELNMALKYGSGYIVDISKILK